MKRYLWIILYVLLSMTTYGATPTEPIGIYSMEAGATPHTTTRLLSGEVDETGHIQWIRQGAFLETGTKWDNDQSLHSFLADYEGKIYLSLYGKTPPAQARVHTLYETLLQDETIGANTQLDLKFAYTPIDETDLDFKNLDYIDVLNMNLYTLSQGEGLSAFKFANNYPIIISDYLAEGYQNGLSEGLDGISKLYYNTLFADSKHIKVDQIFVCSTLSTLPPKYTQFYQTLKEDLQPIKVVDTKAGKVGLQIEDSTLKLLIKQKDTRPISYVEYKANEETVGQSFRYPYLCTLTPSALHAGINQIKVVIKFQGDEPYETTSFYLNNKVEGGIQYGKRQARKEKVYPVTQTPIYKKPYIPVLMYHKFKDQVANTKEDQSMSVSTKVFESQLKALLEAGYTPINFKTLQAYLEGKGGLPPKPFILTADDGYLGNYTKAYPILKKYQVQATFFITSLYMGVNNTHDHFTWSEAKEMEGSGLIDIQSHTHGHTLMNTLNESDVHYEVEKSFADIEKNLGTRDVKVLAYPQFLHTKATTTWVQDCGVDLQVTNLANRLRENANKTTAIDIKRIHVSNDLSPEGLISIIKGLTQ